MSIPLDPRYIPAFSIEDVLLNKDTGAPLSGGLVYFEQDNQRGILKPVYQITGTSPDYTFTQLPNPVELSAIGTFEDALGNPQIPYFYPYNEAGDPELYYIRVTSSEGVEQFTREAQPYLAAESNAEVSSAFENELSNPQFATVNFDTSTSSYQYSVTSVSNEVIEIAPGWEVVITCTGLATITVGQFAPQGSQNLPTNFGTALTIRGDGNISYFRLRQRIYGSPNLWGNGWLSAYWVGATYSGSDVDVRMNYTQSNGTVSDYEIFTATLDESGDYQENVASIELPESTSVEFYPDAYIQIEFVLPVSTKIGITSVMVASTNQTSVANIAYDQQSNDRQIDHLFHYYQPWINFKPIPSFLVGWDFPLNPAQEHVSGSLGALGDNTAAYAWDQTIIFQTVDDTVSYDRGTDGSFKVTASNNTQIAVIQYLEGTDAINILLNDLSSNLRMYGDTAGTATVTIWYTTNATLPDLSTNAVFFTGLDADGIPTGVIANWNEVPRGAYGNATASFNATLNDYGFHGWGALDQATAETATFFAIVVSTNEISGGDTVSFNSVSLVPGNIPTIPAPQTAPEVLKDCEYYYETSYGSNVPAPTATAANQLIFRADFTKALYLVDVYPYSFTIQFKSEKRVSVTPVLYSYLGTNPDTITVAIIYYDTGGSTWYTLSTGVGIYSPLNYVVTGVGNKACSFLVRTNTYLHQFDTDQASPPNPNPPIALPEIKDAYIALHYITDARLGLVN